MGNRAGNANETAERAESEIRSLDESENSTIATFAIACLRQHEINREVKNANGRRKIIVMEFF